MSEKKPNFGLVLAASIIGVVSLPVAAFVSITLGIIMMILPVFMTYAASK
ncbi:MAG: hypothetical protein ACC707_01425 [Thiohalomonadales bacterium]